MHEPDRHRALECWLRIAESADPKPPSQRPEQQLLAEHQLTVAVLAAMEEEARRILAGRPLRPEFWDRVVDFIGNFGHRVHRQKEERVFFPLLEDWGLLEPADCRKLEADHLRLRDVTLLLCDGVAEGDWEKVFRLVSIYLSRIRSHLAMEEKCLLSPAVVGLDDAALAPIADEFAAIEARAFAAGGRRRFVEVVRSVCRDVGIEEPFAPQRPAPACAASRPSGSGARADGDPAAIRVRDVMTAEVATVSPETSLAELERLLSARRVSGAPVVAGDRLVGVVSRADVVRVLGEQEGAAELAVSFYQSPWDEEVSPVEIVGRASAAFAEKLRHLRVRDAMSDHVLFVSPDATLEAAARTMAERGVHRLLVWEDGDLCGIVSALDVARAVADNGLACAPARGSRAKA